MPESHAPAAYSPGWPSSGDPDALYEFTVRYIRNAVQESQLRDADDEVLTARVSALEEVLAARWPHRWLLAARLRRRLRASVRRLGYAGPTFADRRAERASLMVHPGGHAVARRGSR